MNQERQKQVRIVNIASQGLSCPPKFGRIEYSHKQLGSWVEALRFDIYTKAVSVQGLGLRHYYTHITGSVSIVWRVYMTTHMLHDHKPHA